MEPLTNMAFEALIEAVTAQMIDRRAKMWLRRALERHAS